MRFNFQTFVSVADRFARTNNYKVIITPPAKLIGKYKIEEMSYLVRSCPLPSRTFETDIVRPGGHFSREQPHSVQYQAFSMQIMVRAAWDEKRLFDEWQDMIYDKESASLSYYVDYVGTIDIAALNKNEDEIYKIKLYEVWPRSVDPVQFQYDTGDVVNLNVDFVYHSWEYADDRQGVE